MQWSFLLAASWWRACAECCHQRAASRNAAASNKHDAASMMIYLQQASACNRPASSSCLHMSPQQQAGHLSWKGFTTCSRVVSQLLFRWLAQNGTEHRMFFCTPDSAHCAVCLPCCKSTCCDKQTLVWPFLYQHQFREGLLG